MSLIKESKHLSIPFDDIKEATRNFTTLIGRGGYGPVYRGHLSLSGQLTGIAVKRLQTDNLSGQGLKEFLTEIQLLSRYKHQNVVSLVGFCEQGVEKFLVYEFAEHGSLEKYLKPNKTRCPLTWKQRIKICVDAARGLDHLHNHVAQNQRVIHRDIKSANILLDHNWKAMIADFGLSKIGHANGFDTFLITNASGTHGYCDPAYIRTGILTKESDVYSFGVVLFEVLCGRLCFINVNSKERFLAPLAQRYYNEKKLDLLIDPHLKNYSNSDSMNVFLEISFQCVQDDRERRPSMGLVLQKLKKALQLLEIEESPEVLELEEALELEKLVEILQMQETLEVQKLVEALKLEVDYEVIKAVFDMPGAPLSYITTDKIYSHLSTGIIVDEDKVCVSINDEGKSQEMISAIKVMPINGDYIQMRSEPKSKFSKVARVVLTHHGMKIKIATQFLSSNVTYAAYLLCKPDSWPTLHIPADHSLVYTLDNPSESYTSYSLERDGNGWLMFELFQTTTFKRTVAFEVTIDRLCIQNRGSTPFLFEGIQFLPIHKFEDENKIEKSEVKNLSTSNKDWGDQLPNDYKKLLYYSNQKVLKTPQRDMHISHQEEAYAILSRGILIKVNSEVNMWFWITKSNGKKCFVLPPTLLSYDKQPHKIKRIPSKDSRIENEVHLSPSEKVVGMHFKLPNGLFSTNTVYGCFLIYKIHVDFDRETMVLLELNDGSVLLTPLGVLHAFRVHQSPVIGPDGACTSRTPINKLNTIQLPRERKDGWLEVNLGNKTGVEWMSMQNQYSTRDKSRFLPRCFSDNQAYSNEDISFSLDPRRFSDITVYLFNQECLTPWLIVQATKYLGTFLNPHCLDKVYALHGLYKNDAFSCTRQHPRKHKHISFLTSTYIIVASSLSVFIC